MLMKIDALTGQGLMRLWGVPSWPDIPNTHYFLWRGVGVFALIDHGTHVDLHMAMKRGERHLCRDAVEDILQVIGKREVHAPIRIEHKHVCNLARKFGFQEMWRGEVTYLDNSTGELIMMRKSV